MSASSETVDPRAPSAEAVVALRLIADSPHWMARLVDRLNPIFIKETRQALKSRQFLGAFFSLLIVSWLISMAAILSGGGQLEYGDAGRELFAAYFVVLSAAILVVVPFGSFRNLLSEREEATFEPLIISALTPRQIVLGKLYSALLQTFLFYSAIAPFMAFTALLQGFDIANVSLVLLLGMLGSLGTSMAALAISSMIKGRVWQTIISLAVLGGLVMAFSTSWGLVVALDYVVDWSDPWFVWGLTTWVCAGLSYVVLLQQVAVSNLTFASDNRSTGLRLICEGQFLLLWAGIAGTFWYFRTYAGAGGIDGLIMVGVVLSLLHWTAGGLFFVTESDELSQRIVRRLPRRAIWRFLLSPFYPGGGRGLILLLLNIAIVAGILLFSWDRLLSAAGIREQELMVVLVLGLYLVIYLNLAAVIARWGRGLWNAFQPLHARIVTLVVIAISMVAPMFVLVFGDYYRSHDYSLWYLSNPVLSVEHISRNGGETVAISLTLCALAVLGTMINLPAIFRGVSEMVSADPLAPSRFHESTAT